MKVLYSIGDSVVWGAMRLENKETERFSHYVDKRMGDNRFVITWVDECI